MATSLQVLSLFNHLEITNQIAYEISILQSFVDFNNFLQTFIDFFQSVKKEVLSMTAFERVKILADQQKISIVQLEEKLGFSRNSLYAWKKNNPSTDKLQKVADYFNVSTDFILGRTNDQSVGMITEPPHTTFYRMDTEGLTSDDIEKIKDDLKLAEEIARKRLGKK